MSPDKNVLRTLFNQRGVGQPNTLIAADEWISYSSTNSRHVAALFRVKNITVDAIMWPVSVRMTAYSGWGERASVALNGVNVFNSGTTNGAGPVNNFSMTIPANRTSTVIFVSGSGQPSGSSRSVMLAFVNNSLALPAGLEFIDDLDTATGGWEQ